MTAEVRLAVPTHFCSLSPPTRLSPTNPLLPFDIFDGTFIFVFVSVFLFSPSFFSFFILRNQLILFFTLFLLFIFLCKLLCIKNNQKKSTLYYRKYTIGNSFFLFCCSRIIASLSYIFFLKVQPKTLAFFTTPKSFIHSRKV